MSALSPDYPLSAEAVFDFLSQKKRTLTPSDPPFSAYILGAGFYFKESPTGERFRSWLPLFTEELFLSRLPFLTDTAFEGIFLQCHLLCLLMLNAPGDPDPTWRGKKQAIGATDDISLRGVPELTDHHLYTYLKELHREAQGFRGYSKGPVGQWNPDGKHQFSFEHHYLGDRKEFRPIEVVIDSAQKSFFETHIFHLMARLNLSGWVFGRLLNKCYLVKPEVAAGAGTAAGQADSSDSSSDSEEERVSYCLPVTDNHHSGNLWRLTALHQGILGLSDRFLNEFLKAYPRMLTEKLDGHGNTFICAFVELPEPKTPEQKAQHLKVWEVVKARLDEAFPDPVAKKAFFERTNNRGLTALQLAIEQLNWNAVEKFFTVFGIDIFMVDAKSGNTILHTLAGSKGPEKKQLALLEMILQLFFKLELDLEKREKFYQHRNKAGLDALRLAANFKNKALVQGLCLVPGVTIEEVKDSSGVVQLAKVDLASLGIEYCTSMFREGAASRERTMIQNERMSSQERVIDAHGEAFRAVSAALEDARQERALLADALRGTQLELRRSQQNQLLLADALREAQLELRRSQQNQLGLMRMMNALCGDLAAKGLIEAGAGFPMQVAAPFLRLGDLADLAPGVDEAKDSAEP